MRSLGLSILRARRLTTASFRSYRASPVAMASSAVAEAAPAAPPATLLSAYKPFSHAVKSVRLDFVLGEEASTVEATAVYVSASASPQPLELHGDPSLELLSVTVDGVAVQPGAGYERTGSGGLRLSSPPASFTLGTKVRLQPQSNTSLEGLYKSGGTFCTQCEAESFRKITFYPDRPDVLSVFTTRVEADKAAYPVLLSNGNCVEKGDLPGGRHFTVWADPWPKPCYLFACVAGDLAVTEGSFTTASGKAVALRIFTETHNADKTAFAMASLVKSMRWDETRFGLEYDLEQFNIVAVDDFNMGAMENKSLNIFNSRLVLASPATATDDDYAAIEGVIGHEYFHNWTGNRVTCRDWFQLSLKEGLTVFRDQEFSADMNSRDVKRIEDVRLLRSRQFGEDAGPMAHPVRPLSYEKIDNFYSLTVYEKGAEVIRLYETLLGAAGFRAGMDLYFKRHDGAAVTCDDFLAAQRDANDGAAPASSFAALAAWYSQAGTPSLAVTVSRDATAKTLTLVCAQSLPATPDEGGGGAKAPQLIPLRVGLLSSPSGARIPLTLGPSPTRSAARMEGAHQAVLFCAEPTSTFVFADVPDGAVVPSLLRGFSAPVALSVSPPLSGEQLAFLLAHDTDAFVKWEAAQQLAAREVLRRYSLPDPSSPSANDEPSFGRLAASLGAVLASACDGSVDRALVAECLSFPDTSSLVDAAFEATHTGVDPVKMHAAREATLRGLAGALRAQLAPIADAPPASAAYEFAPPAVAGRALRNAATSLLAKLGGGELGGRVASRLASADSLTDELAALSAAASSDWPGRQAALDSFQAKWAHSPLVTVKWLGVAAATVAAPASGAPPLERLASLMASPPFKLTTPNHCYAVLGGFARRAVPAFHAADGSGYAFLADSLLKLDAINPQCAARCADPLTHGARLEGGRRAAMRAQLARLLAHPGLSPNLAEICRKSLS